MTVTNFQAANDGEIESNSVTYNEAAEGYGFWKSDVETSTGVGQNLDAGTYYCDEFFSEFNTAAINTDDISVATLTMWLTTNNIASQSHSINVYAYDWGGGAVGDADWRTPTQLAALPLVASFAITSATGTGSKEFSSETAMLTNINKTGYTRFVVASSRLGTAPTTQEQSSWASLNNGTSAYRPVLSVTHASGPAVPTIVASQSGSDIVVTWS